MSDRSPSMARGPDEVDPWAAGDGVRFRRITANGLEFPAIEAGSGPLVLCLHGFPDYPGTWRPVLKILAARGFWAVAPALRGYWPGGAAPDRSYRPAAGGEDVVALIRALDRGHACVVGHDLGARVAFAAASLAPHRVRRLVGMAVPFGSAVGRAFVTDGDQQRRSWYMFFFQTWLAEAAVRHDDFALIDRLWRDWSPRFRLPARDQAALHRVLAEPGVLSEALAYYRQMFIAPPEDPREARAAGPVTAPTLYLHGAEDGCIASELSEGMEPLFRGGLTRRVLDGCGHFLHLEQPATVAGQIADFLTAKAA